MKISEISLSKEFSRNSRLYDLERLFIKYNWHFLGRGIDASVAEHPHKKYVLKVFQTKSKYRDFVNLARAHENNPHFPKFYGGIKTIPGREEYNFIRMEKLTSIVGLYTLFLSEMLYLYTKSEYYGVGLDISYELKDGVYDRYKISYDVDLTNDEIWDTVPKPSGAWMQATDLICAIANQDRKILLDIHHDNFMTRNGVLVYLDPFLG